MSAPAATATPELLKVRTATDPNELATCLFTKSGPNLDVPITLRAIGAGAVNQAIKGVIISGKNFAKKGLYPAIVPTFKDLEIENTTAIEFRLVLRKFGE